MRRNAQRHSVEPGRDDGRDEIALAKYNRHRAWPERASDTRCVLRPFTNERPGRAFVGNVNNERVVRRPALCRIDSLHRVDVERIRAESIHGLRRKRDQSAATKNLRRTSDHRGFRRRWIYDDDWHVLVLRILGSIRSSPALTPSS